MTNRLRILALLLTALCFSAWAEPALAARLASVSGEGDATEERESDEFKLGDQTDVDINFTIKQKTDDCNVHIRLLREQNGDWLVVNNVHHTQASSSGSRTVTLPAGTYRIEVVAKHAKYSVTVDN